MGSVFANDDSLPRRRRVLLLSAGYFGVETDETTSVFFLLSHEQDVLRV